MKILRTIANQDYKRQAAEIQECRPRTSQHFCNDQTLEANGMKILRIIVNQDYIRQEAEIQKCRPRTSQHSCN